jgi:hypothetical protein
MKPPTKPQRVKTSPIPAPDEKPNRAPKTSPAIASAPLPARNCVGVMRLPRPEASSFSRTASMLIFGFSLRT